MSCLNRRLGEMKALIEVFAKADQKVIEHAGAATSGLRSLSWCSDVHTLKGLVTLPRTRAQGGGGPSSGELAHVRALRGAGKYEKARELAQGLMPAAQRLAHRPLEAEVQLALGDACASAGDYRLRRRHSPRRR